MDGNSEITPTSRPTARTVRVTRERPRRGRARTVARLVAGVVLLGIGLVGLLAPILPGWLLIFVGLALLGINLPFLDRMKERVTRKVGRTR